MRRDSIDTYRLRAGRSRWVGEGSSARREAIDSWHGVAHAKEHRRRGFDVERGPLDQTI